ncbi:lysophospholipid acyltransferase family protein [Mesorhizobium jarvisii]|uniref:lysophospholipid acyltransferase family protein n=1 Tax=Mesorhizobium jarvisii TaxID=1777867 RepID=UPI003B8A8997
MLSWDRRRDGGALQSKAMSTPLHCDKSDQERWSRRIMCACRDAAASATSIGAEVILRVWSASWRKNTEQILLLDRLLAEGAPVLAVFWHGKYFPLFALAEGRHATVFVGQSFRGEIIARICRRFGYEAVLIPAHSRSGDAYRLIVDRLSATRFGVLAVDGPLGPYHQVKLGTVRLASQLQFLIVPVSVASDPKCVLASRWDQRELPYPLATVALSLGEPIRIPKGLDRKGLLEWSDLIRTRLEAVDADAKARTLRSRPLEAKSGLG